MSTTLPIAIPTAVDAVIDVLAKAAQLDASDVHLIADKPAAFQINGQLSPRQDIVLKEAELKAFLNAYAEDAWQRFEVTKQLDAGAFIPEVGRVRIYACKSFNELEVDVRLFKVEIPTLDLLDVPKVVGRQLLDATHGLIIVTGPMGSGKTTLLAAMINHLNDNRPMKITILEDPVEYYHQNKKAYITQREIGSHAVDFKTALKGTLRSASNAILVGEMRDLETMAAALTTAETGHLVMATLHTADAVSTISRFIDVFPPEQKDQVKVQLANSLLMVIATRLVPLADGSGRRGVLEILIKTDAVKGAIIKSNPNDIQNALNSGAGIGMQTMERHLVDLCKRGKITQDLARLAAPRKTDFDDQLRLA